MELLSLPFPIIFLIVEVNEIFQNLSTLDQIIHRDILLGYLFFVFLFILIK